MRWGNWEGQSYYSYWYRELASKLIQTQFGSITYSGRKDFEIVELKEAIQPFKFDYLLVIKQFTRAQKELAFLYQRSENCKAKLPTVVSAVSKRKAYEANLNNKSMQEGENKVLSIIRRFYHKWNTNFIEIREKDVSDT